MGIFNCLLFILPGSKPAMFTEFAGGFLTIHQVESTDEMQSEGLFV